MSEQLKMGNAYGLEKLHVHVPGSAESNLPIKTVFQYMLFTWNHGKFIINKCLKHMYVT